MRPLARLALAALVAVTVPVLSACESLDNFEIFDSKKKLAGERKPVFPEGIPGVATGVPPELVRGYREPEGGAPADPAKAAAEAAAEQSAKPKPKAAKPAPQRTASRPPPQRSADPYAAAPSAAQAPPQQPAPQAAPLPTIYA